MGRLVVGVPRCGVSMVPIITKKDSKAYPATRAATIASEERDNRTRSPQRWTAAQLRRERPHQTVQPHRVISQNITSEGQRLRAGNLAVTHHSGERDA